ncbi:uncharacterized protein LOC122638869 [Telopea speciosissima]|uniref:uncharacterized protein LOC122638869 n=1 Tax=Telopea speciosissima TaxID=54955 RepID=UPI001CC497F9|nr:uncharacterized protein LOC122638869 [Telopea speciosissima]
MPASIGLLSDFSLISRPLCSLLAKDAPFIFDDKCLHAFHTLHDSLAKAPIMRSPDWSYPFEIMCDASDYAIGAALGQRVDGKPVMIYYASKILSDAQMNYTTTEELLVVVFVLDKFRSYLLGLKISAERYADMHQMQVREDAEFLERIRDIQRLSEENKPLRSQLASTRLFSSPSEAYDDDDDDDGDHGDGGAMMVVTTMMMMMMMMRAAVTMMSSSQSSRTKLRPLMGRTSLLPLSQLL